MKKEIGYIGLGKMGYNMSLRLIEYGWNVVAYDQSPDTIKRFEKEDGTPAHTIDELFVKLSKPYVVWIMVPHQAVDSVLDQMKGHIQEGDIVIDGGNSPYTQSMKRAQEMQTRAAHYLDVGISGGPSGARSGACAMIGGPKEVYQQLEELFKTISAQDAYKYVGPSGAGHFVKMVHNGIEYGMMQAIAEGFDIMKQSTDFDLNLVDIADVYNHKSVIESRLIEWMKKAFEQHGQDLENISGSASASGEGAWTIKAAEELGVDADVIEEALMARTISQMTPTYQGKIISALRNQFGGHEVNKKK